MPTTLDQPKVEVRQAVESAKRFFIASFSAESLRNLQLEEIGMTEDGKLWLVTLGYDDPAHYPSQLGVDITALTALLPRPSRPLRKYKVVQVSSESGEALAVKNR